MEIIDTEEISLENVLRRCGDFGVYQWIHFVMLCIINFSGGMTGFYYVFGLAEPEFRCRLPEDIWPNDNQYLFANETHQQLMQTYMSLSSKCENINGSKCTDFVFDRSVYGLTFTEEASFVCDDALKKTWLNTAHAIGTFTVLVTGPLSDRIGRKRLLQILSLTLYIVSTITQLILQFVSMNAKAKFAVLLINQLISGVDGYGICFLLIMELTSSSHTSFAAGVSLVAYTLGEILFTGFAFASQHWLNLKWLISIYFAVTVPYLYFIPESPYWLFTKKKYPQLEANLRTIAKVNRKKEEDWLPKFQLLVENAKQQKDEQDQQIQINKKKTYLRFIPRLIISGFIEFVTMLLYTKISYGLGEENGTLSPYTNFIIGAAVEGVGYLIAGLLITTILGRKYSFILFAILTSICVIIIPFILYSHPTVTTVLSQVGKLSISGAVSVSWLYVPELFPTYMRGLANAIFVFIGNFGSILAPIVETGLGEKHERVSYYIYAALTLVLSIIIFLTLPETRNNSFNDDEQQTNQNKTTHAFH